MKAEGDSNSEVLNVSWLSLAIPVEENAAAMLESVLIARLEVRYEFGAERLSKDETVLAGLYKVDTAWLICKLVDGCPVRILADDCTWLEMAWLASVVLRLLSEALVVTDAATDVAGLLRVTEDKLSTVWAKELVEASSNPEVDCESSAEKTLLVV